ncbi:MAG: hypothetical protein COA78_15685 [Blastopirellula sp.]|nr:MAG: hypothetical protein COA78_15685 [Blastopirellula sp.]
MKIITSHAVTILSGLLLVIGLHSAVKGAECNQHGVAAYAAVQDIDSVTVFAVGVHRTSGYTNCLILGPEDIFPPIYDFKIAPPTGTVPQLITPFTVHSTFTSEKPLKGLTVRDANGKHRVKIVQLLQKKQESDSTLGEGKRLQLNSVYLNSPVDFGFTGKGCRGIRITGLITQGETIDLALDPNTCSLNEFGDRTICTEIAHTRLKVKLEQIRLSDSRKLNRKIYRLESKKFPKSLTVYLIVPRTESGYRIVLKRPDSTVVVSLEKSPNITKKK